MAIRVTIEAGKEAQKLYSGLYIQKKLQRRVAAKAPTLIKKVAEHIKIVLGVEPPPRAKGVKIRWKSSRQRSAVMAFLRERATKEGRDTLQYQRTHRLRDGWEVSYEPPRSVGELGRIKVVNEKARAVNAKGRRVYYTKFVVGLSTNPIQQQPFHADLGWYRLQDTISAGRSAFNEVVIEGLREVMKK